MNTMKNVNDQNKVKKKGDILKKGQGIYKKQINVFFHFKNKKIALYFSYICAVITSVNDQLENLVFLEIFLSSI